MNTEAIVIADDHYNGLGMIRSLGENGIPVNLILMSNKNRTYINKSKYVNNVIFVNHSEEEIIESVKSFSYDSHKRYFVFPLSDFSAIVIDKNYNVFNKNLEVPNMNGHISLYADKEKSKKYAKERGFNIAKSVVVDFQDFKMIPWYVFPAIIKPVISVEGFKSHIVVVDNKIDLEKALRRFKSFDYKRVLIEEYIHSSDEYMIEVMGVSNKQETKILGIIKKIREYPMQRGSTSYAEIIDEHPMIDIKKIEEFINGLEFSGLFDMEFKYANGSAVFLECNFRNGAPSYALSSIGRNVPLKWINMLQTGTIVPNQITANRVFMCEQMDILNMLKRQVGFFAWLKQWKNSFHVFGNKHDPKPVMYYYLFFIQDMIKSMFSHCWFKQ